MTEVEQELSCLQTMGHAELQMAWQRFHKSDPPNCMSKELLRLAISYKQQEQMSGGLSRRTLLRIKALNSKKSYAKSSRQIDERTSLKPGTKLLREWQGKIHEVLTLEQGQFAFNGKVYRSLSIIAQEITGAHWSGPRFFGLRTAAGSASGALEHG